MREKKSEGPRKRVDRREGDERLYSDKTWSETRAYVELEVSRLMIPDDRRKFPEPM